MDEALAETQIKIRDRYLKYERSGQKEMVDSSKNFCRKTRTRSRRRCTALRALASRGASIRAVSLSARHIALHQP
jgi:hypothetical protein